MLKTFKEISKNYKLWWSPESLLLFVGWQQTLFHSFAYNFLLTTPNQAREISLEAQDQEEETL